MLRESIVYLKDIIEAIQRIEKYTQNISFDDFKEKELIQDGVVRNLEIIGEAVKNIPDDVKNKKPEVEWRKISGLRDILAHAYFGMDKTIVWDVVKNKIPELKIQISELLSEMQKKTKNNSLFCAIFAGLGK